MSSHSAVDYRVRYGSNEGVQSAARTGQGDGCLLAPWIRERLDGDPDEGDGHRPAESLRHLRRQARALSEGTRLLPGRDQRRHAANVEGDAVRQGRIWEAPVRPGG